MDFRFKALPDFGRHLGYDGKAIERHRTGRANLASGETSDPDANWGKHEIAGIDARTGELWNCICPQTGEQRDLAFQGFEADCNTLK